MTNPLPKGIFGRSGPLPGWFFIRDLASGLYFTRAGGPTAPRRLADPIREWEMKGVALSYYGSDTFTSTKVQFERVTAQELARATGRRNGASRSDRKRNAAQRNGRLNPHAKKL
jgi:hypothetical protein